MRNFEKISFEQFKKDVKDDIELYNSYPLPKRESINAAGYDIYLLDDLAIESGNTIKIPTGIKSYFEQNEVLFLIIRSGVGFKYNIRMCNQVGVIDSDYYNNSNNEGHIWIKIQNEGKKKVSFKKGEAIVQGIFLNFLCTDNDSNSNLKRVGKY